MLNEANICLSFDCNEFKYVNISEAGRRGGEEEIKWIRAGGADEKLSELNILQMAL